MSFLHNSLIFSILSALFIGIFFLKLSHSSSNFFTVSACAFSNANNCASESFTICSFNSVNSCSILTLHSSSSFLFNSNNCLLYNFSCLVLLASNFSSIFSFLINWHLLLFQQSYQLNIYNLKIYYPLVYHLV